jgi:hypothetical protein
VSRGPLPRWLWPALGACAVIWLVTLGMRGLFNPDEGRYAEIPREMLASGDWVIPHLDGLVYIEKPPLQYWATALSEALFGANDWAARLYTGLCALVTAFATWALIRREWGAAAAARGAVMLGSSLLFVLLGHQLTLDMSLTLFMTLTLVGFCNAQRPAARWQPWMALSWVGIAGAFMTKGLIAGVLPIFTLVAYCVVQRDLAPWRRLLLVRGAALFGVLCLPWLLLIQHRLPQFFQFFFIREHFQRYLTKIEDRYQPWWFFVPVLLLGILPWLVPARELAPGNVRPAPVRLAVVPGRVRVFLGFGLQADSIHPADVPGPGAAHGHGSGAAPGRRPARHGCRAAAAGRRAAGRGGPAAALPARSAAGTGLPRHPPRAGADGCVQPGRRRRGLAAATGWPQAHPRGGAGRLRDLDRGAVGGGRAGAHLLRRRALRAAATGAQGQCTGVQRAHV